MATARQRHLLPWLTCRTKPTNGTGPVVRSTAHNAPVCAKGRHIPNSVRRLWAATADAALLFAVMARYALLARRIDQPAALLAVPEVAWTGFATVLSTTVAAINSQ